MNKINLVIISAFVLLCSCSKGRSEDDPIIPEPTPTESAEIFERPSWSFTLHGNENLPAWVNPDPHKFSGSMVGYVALSAPLISDIESDDLLGVFYGDECRFVTHIDDATQIPIIVMGNEDERDNISMRYYSNKRQMSFIADNVTSFGIDKQCDLMKPDFVPSKYPIVMTTDLQVTLIDASTGKEQIVSQSSNDLLAALIGDECRAVVSGNSSGYYTLTIYGNHIGDNIELQFYHNATKHKFTGNLQLEQGFKSATIKLNVIKK